MELPELETICHVCQGKCVDDKGGRCQHCMGTASEPTEFGKKLLSLIKNNLVTMSMIQRAKMYQSKAK